MASRSANIQVHDPAQGRAARKRPRLPPWLRKPLVSGNGYEPVKSCIAGKKLHTVCVEASCPNRAECFSAGTATFLILGNVCTRDCAFCGVTHGKPLDLDNNEPLRVAQAAAALNLRHIVITSVTRDDLPDGGAAQFVACVTECRGAAAGATVELLVPDFSGSALSIAAVIDSKPDILNHNLETVPRLYKDVRPGADYHRSLDIIAKARSSGLIAKSGLMVGLGETETEINAVLRDLKNAGCDIVTIGQYLQPSVRQAPVSRFETPLTFKNYERLGRELGMTKVIAGPFVRSSYRAHEFFLQASRNPEVHPDGRIDHHGKRSLPECGPI
jgi:lipoic acid synthetase